MLKNVQKMQIDLAIKLIYVGEGQIFMWIVHKKDGCRALMGMG